MKSTVNGGAHPVPEHERMQAIVQYRYGGPEVLELGSMELPSPGEGEVLVRLHAAGIDRGTWHLMAGLPYVVRLGFGFTGPKNPVPGLDLAGTVEAVGAAVTRFEVGDEVFGIGGGSLAEYTVASEEKLSHKPAEITFEQAAVSAVSGIAALEAVADVAKVTDGQRVLVLGASGGVGSFAVQVAKALGARVTGVASASKHDLVRELGADEVIDYRTQDFASLGGEYDVIIDTGGRNTLRRLRSVLAPKGTLVIVGGEGGNKLTGGFGRSIRAGILSPFSSVSMPFFLSTEHHRFMDRLAKLMESGEVVPAIGQIRPLVEVAEAMREMETGAAQGKTVITIS
ncbi:MAG: NAD(P)-dependent alcohol dehydrogenase [Microthrixaceae bacterium]